MIRVWFKGVVCPTELSIYQFMGKIVAIKKLENVIEKIEKQVKDLTLEEIYKLKINCNPPYNEYIADVENNMLELTDYIDITDLVKEQGV